LTNLQLVENDYTNLKMHKCLIFISSSALTLLSPWQTSGIKSLCVMDIMSQHSGKPIHTSKL